jgi:hypothetical protein
VGLLYRNDNDEVRLSHLPWHFRFNGSDDPGPLDYWLEPHFNDMVQEQVVAFLLHRAEEQGKGDIPYSILRQGKSFDAAGKYVPAGIGEGLTCATYVLAAFEALEISIIDLQSWPVGRAEDQAWFQQILQRLGQLVPPASPEHIQAQQQALPNVVRYRPEEVAAAFSLFTNRDLSFDDVRPTSLEILEFLNTPPAAA